MNKTTYCRDDFSKLFKYIESVIEDEKLPTGVLGIAQKEKILTIETYGNWSNGSKVSSDDIYLLFSVTKPIVATAVMQLWEQGKLHLNEPVSKYIPEFSLNKKDNITIWHLLTHTSGMQQKAIERILIEKPFPNIDLFTEFINAELDFPVGTKKAYNNLTFSVLGEIIKRVSGTDYDEYIEKNIFFPLGMKNTSFFKQGMDQSKFIPIENPFEVNVKEVYEMKFPAGGLSSTVNDLMIFGQALLNQGYYNNFRLLSQATLNTMITPQTKGISSFDNADFNGAEVGLSWLLPLNSHSIIYRNIYGHHGMGNSMLWIYPEKELALVFLSNLAGPAKHDMQWDYILNVFSSCL